MAGRRCARRVQSASSAALRAETTHVLPITDQSIDSAWATARGVPRAIQAAVFALAVESARAGESLLSCALRRARQRE